MSAEGNLYNPALFVNQYPKHADLALEYIEIVKSLKTPTPLVAVKGHLFKLMRPALAKETDLRNRLGTSRGGLPEYEEIVKEMKTRMDVSCNFFFPIYCPSHDYSQEQSAPFAGMDIEGLATVHETSGLKLMPHWVVQPYFRPLPSGIRVTAPSFEKLEGPHSTVTQYVEVVAGY
jgi:tRNA-dihydrouridine synthase 1